MDHDTRCLFQIANPVAILGWIALLATPLAPIWSQRLAALIIPALLSVSYTALILAFWSGMDGGFDSLENVMRLLAQPEAALAGWLHYLAFDLFVGAWIARTARSEAIPHLLIIPCLILTFLFGPAGFLSFLLLRTAFRFAPPSSGKA